MATMDLFELKEVTKRYAGVAALEGISLSVGRGEVFGILGENGAGKSTLLSIMAGIARPTSGQVYLAGQNLFQGSGELKKTLGYVPQELALYQRLSVNDNLNFWGRAHGLKGSELKNRIANVLEIVNLRERGRDRVEHLSGGMKRRLNIAVALLHNPQAIIMDEPTVGLDLQSRQAIWQMIQQIRDKGASVILTSHYLEDLENCDRLTILKSGRVLGSVLRRELQKKGSGFQLEELYKSFNESGTKS